MNIKKIAVCLTLEILLAGCSATNATNPAPQNTIPTTPAITVQTQPLAHGVLQTGRYETTSIGASPSQINPLLTVATFRFAPEVQNIGEALHQVLQYSGYALANSSSPDIADTLNQPLPWSLRVLGPIQIQDALTVLMGQNVYNLVIDPLHRLVSFEVKPNIANALYVSRHTHSGNLLTN